MAEQAVRDAGFRPVAGTGRFFDWASTAPLSSACVCAMAGFAEEQATHLSPPDFLTTRTAGLDALRERVRAVFGAGGDAEVALVRSVAEASSALARALPMPPSCDVLVTSADHPALVAAWCRAAARRPDVRLLTVPCLPSGLLDLDRAEQLLSARTAVVLCTHMTHLDGIVQPVAELAALTRRRSRALVVVDAAQSAGRVPVDFRALGADVLLASGRKALLGPLGSGFLIAGPGVLDSPDPLVVSTRNCRAAAEAGGRWRPNPDVRTGPAALEGNLPDLRSLYGLLASLTAYRQAGPEQLARGCRAAAAAVTDAAARVGFTAAGPPESTGRHGIVRLRSPRAVDHTEVKRRLAGDGFSLAATADWLRVSVHAFTTDDDIAGLFTGLAPFGVPPRLARSTS